MNKTETNLASQAVDAAALVKSTADSVAMALNIQYIQRDLAELKTAIKDLSARDGLYMSKTDGEKRLTKAEDRISANEKNITIVMTWGAALVVGLSIAQFLIGKFL